jgi:hypothetical protein
MGQKDMFLWSFLFLLFVWLDNQRNSRNQVFENSRYSAGYPLGAAVHKVFTEGVEHAK